MADHSHYFKDVSFLDEIDVYRVIDLFGVTNPAQQHAVKKVLCAGNRKHKNFIKDIEEAISSLKRVLEMERENLDDPKQIPNTFVTDSVASS